MTVVAGTKPGYKIGREGGLTERERQVMGCLGEGLDLPRAGERLGITKQRVQQIVKALEAKGRVTRSDDGTITLVVGRSDRTHGG